MFGMLYWTEQCQGCWGLGMIRVTPITPTLHSTQVQTFHGDLLQHMEKNTKLDMQFIKVSVAAHLGPPAHHRQDGLSLFNG